MTNAEHFYVTSSIVKEIAVYGGDVGRFVPEGVSRRLARKFGLK